MGANNEMKSKTMNLTYRYLGKYAKVTRAVTECDLIPLPAF